MGKTANDRHVADSTFAAITTTQPGLRLVDRGFPAGDEGIIAINYRYGGTFNTSSAAGSPVTDGAHKILRSLTVETDKHGQLIKGVDGLGLHRMHQLENGTREAYADCASNADGATFRSNLRICFADEERLRRPHDCLLDMKNAKMTVKSQFGIVTDIQSAGTAPTINSLRDDISVEVQPGPLNDGSPAMNKDERGNPIPNPESRSEMPGFIPIREKRLYAISATQPGYQIPIPVGDRIMRRIYISQQTIDPSSGLVSEVSNLIAATAAVSLKIGQTIIQDRLTWAEMSERNKRTAQVETMPTGWGFLDFDRTMQVTDMLDLYKYPSGLAANLEIDVTTQTNGYLVIYFDYLQLPPPQSVRS